MKGDQYIIGITGGSGSGKTTFVRKLKKRFEGQPVCFISLDNYYLPREQQVRDEQGVQNFDLPQSIESERLLNDLNQLRAGKAITKKEYTFNNEDAVAEDITISPAPIIIIEGLFIYHYDVLKDLFDLKLYIYAKDNLKLIRRIKRDRSERNYPLEDVIYRYEHHVMPSYEKYIKAYKDDADIIINNNKNLEKGLEVVAAFMQSKLSAIK